MIVGQIYVGPYYTDAYLGLRIQLGLRIGTASPVANVCQYSEDLCSMGHCCLHTLWWCKECDGTNYTETYNGMDKENTCSSSLKISSNMLTIYDGLNA